MCDDHHQVLICGRYGRLSSPAYASPRVERCADHHRASLQHCEMMPSITRYQPSVVFRRRLRRRDTALVVRTDKLLFHSTSQILPLHHHNHKHLCLIRTLQKMQSSRQIKSHSSPILNHSRLSLHREPPQTNQNIPLHASSKSTTMSSTMNIRKHIIRKYFSSSPPSPCLSSSMERALL
jgi:hypothetical protein